MANSIQIFGDFDGGNPQDPDSIIQTGPNAFTIIPYSEDNDPNYKFRLDVKVTNSSSEPRKIDLTIDWQEPRFNHLRNYVYLKHSDDSDWTYHPMQAGRTKVAAAVDVKPGKTYVCLHPKYNYNDYLRFVAGITESEFIKKEKIGVSPEGREVWLINIGAEMERGRQRIMLVSRIHPYETSGSFCIEGIVDHFSDHFSHFTSDISPIYLIPMANPDGVFSGLCKKTSIGGIDLSKESDESDGLWRIIVDVIDSIQPTVYCEFHNWMFPIWDGIYDLNWLQAKKFIRNMPSQRSFQKVWKPMLNKKVLATSHHGFKKYCYDRYKCLCLCVEYPWSNRQPKDMRKLGIDTLNALSKFYAKK